MVAAASRWLLPAAGYTCVLVALTLWRWSTRTPLSWGIVFGAVALNGALAFGVATAFELADRIRRSGRDRRWLWTVPIALAAFALSWHTGSELVGAIAFFEGVGYSQAIAVALAGGVLLLLGGLRADAFGNRRIGVAVLAVGLTVLVWAQDHYRMQLREAHYAGVSAAFLVLTSMLALRAGERLLAVGRADGRALKSVLLPLCVFVLLSAATSEFAIRRLYFAGLFPGRVVFALYYPQFARATRRSAADHRGEALESSSSAASSYPAAPVQAADDQPSADEIVVLAVIDAGREDAFARYARDASAKLHEAWRASCHVGSMYSPASDTVGSLARIMLRPGTEETWLEVLRAAGIETSLAIDRDMIDKLDRRMPSRFSPHFDAVAALERSSAGAFAPVSASVAELVRGGRGRQFVWAHFFEVHAWLSDPDAGPEEYDARMKATGDAIADVARLLAAQPRRASLIVTADHGEGIDHFSTRTHGHFLYEPLVRTPLMVWTNRGACSPALRALRDEPPLTALALGRLVLDQFGIASDARLPDLAQLAAAPIVMHGGIQKAVIRWPHKLIVSPWFMELFDLANDPSEQHDLVDERAELASELRALLP